MAVYFKTDVGSMSSELPVEFRRLENVEKRLVDGNAFDVMSMFLSDAEWAKSDADLDDDDEDDVPTFVVREGIPEKRRGSLTKVKVARWRW